MKRAGVARQSRRGGAAAAASRSEPSTGTTGPRRAVGLPVVVIVGRPNVGKSTLFNRLCGRRAAIVHDTPGITRDQNIVATQWDERPVLCVDTGGFEAGTTGDETTALVRQASRRAIGDADVVVFVLDGRAGLSPADREAVALVRRLGRPVVYVINKIDTPGVESLAYDFARLGLDPLVTISAEHARGIDDLRAEVLSCLPAVVAAEREAPAPVDDTRLALIGRPNVGKSSLLNRLCGSERAIVASVPGTTRDPIDAHVRLGPRSYLLVDTAGIRRRARITAAVERLTTTRSLRAIDRTQIALLVLDVSDGVADQDARLAAYAWEQGRALVFVVNKADLLPAGSAPVAKWRETLRHRYPAFAAVPAVFVSAKTGAGIDRLIATVRTVEERYFRVLRTRRCNQVLAQAVAAQAPPSIRGKPPRFFYASQVSIAPPVVAIATSDPTRVQKSYERYLRSRFTAEFDLQGCPLGLEFRPRR
jgi:GTP-binding protein